MTTVEDLSPGDVVQINPRYVWGGCFMVITLVRRAGADGYISLPGPGDTSSAYLRGVNHEEMDKIGRAIWWQPHDEAGRPKLRRAPGKEP